MKHVKLLVFLVFICLKSLSAQDADIFVMTGNAKDQLGNLQGAINDYTLAIQADSNYVMAYFNRAFVKRKLNDYEGAIEDYTLAIKLKPQYEIAYNNRGIVYMLLDKKELACTDWEKARDLGYPDAQKLLIEYCYNVKDTIR